MRAGTRQEWPRQGWGEVGLAGPVRFRDYSLQLNGTAPIRLWRVAEGKCGPIVARLSDFYKRSQNSHILMEILQILKCWQKKKKNSIFYSSSQHLQVEFSPWSASFRYSLCLSILVFVIIDFTSLFMSSSSLALREWPCLIHSCIPSGWSKALPIEDT